MNIFRKLIKSVVNLLKLAFRKNTKAQKKIKELIQRYPKLAKSIQKGVLAKENITSQTSKNLMETPISGSDYQQLKSEYFKTKMKKQYSTIDKQFMDFVENVIIEDDNKDEVYYFKNSRFLIMLIYKKKSKTALIQMKDGKMLYPFYNVPKSKVIELLLKNGEYMWDYFGRKYSNNPTHWIRKGESK